MDWPIIASIIYTITWSVSFYGQIYDNYKLKNVEGFSVNYLTMSINGYVIYGIYSSVGYFTKIPGAGTVVIADLVFVYHALLMVFIQAWQCWIYPVRVLLFQWGKNRISKYTLILCISLWVIIIVQIFFTIVVHAIPWTQYWNPIGTMGYSKLVVSFTKYYPAMYWNYKRKSTNGWSIFNIILVFVGGIFSLASGSMSVENGLNITKLVLAILIIIYCVIFIVQHFFLYRSTKKQNRLKQINKGLVIDEKNELKQQII